MISMNAIDSAGGAASYYTEQATIEYYADEKVPSQWQGRAAEIMGLSGEVSAKDLTSVLDGQVKDYLKAHDGRTVAHDKELGRTRLDKETGEYVREHRAGWDLTFSPSKSVSIESEVFGRKDVRQAHEQAVLTAMQYLENHAAVTRVNKQEVDTGNLVYACFSHATSRAGDPQTHTHVLVANVTYHEGVAYSLSNEKLMLHRTTADAVYKNELANSLQQLGYQIEHHGKGDWEIAGYSKEQLADFSKRSTEIENALQERGMSKDRAGYEARQIAALASREKKAEGHSERAEAHQERWQAESSVKQAAERSGPQTERTTAKEVVSNAVASLSEREQVFGQKNLVKEATALSAGQVSSKDILSEIERQKEDGRLLSSDPDRAGARYTTKEAMEAEKHAEQAISGGRDAHVAVMSEREFGKALEAFQARKEAEGLRTAQEAVRQARDVLAVATTAARSGTLGKDAYERESAAYSKAVSDLENRTPFSLKPEQVEAARLILTNQDKFVGVQGYAGTGKTTLLEFVREAAEAKGWQVVGLSNGAKQASTLQAESGIKSSTVASFLATRHDDKVGLSKTLYVNDEASMSSQKDFNGVIDVAQQTGAKVAFVGDKAQHQSVESGAAFERAQGEMQVASLKEISRQQTEQAKAPVRAIMAGNHAEAMRLTAVEIKPVQLVVEQKWRGMLEAQGNLTAKQVVLSKEELAAARQQDNRGVIATMAKDYVAQQPQERQQTIIVTATNADRQAINGAIRAELRAAGQLQDGHTVQTLVQKDMTEARKAWAAAYDKGDVLVKDGQDKQLTVVGVHPSSNLLSVLDADGRQSSINASEAAKMTAFNEKAREFATGDRVMFFHNSKASGIKNGQVGTIEQFDGRKMTVNVSGHRKEVDLSTYKQIDHAYAVTSHKSQGDSVRNVFIHHNTEAGKHGQREDYVNKTRARISTRTYTQNADLAAKQAGKEVNKTVALPARQRDLQPREPQQAGAEQKAGDRFKLFDFVPLSRADVRQAAEQKQASRSASMVNTRTQEQSQPQGAKQENKQEQKQERKIGRSRGMSL